MKGRGRVDEVESADVAAEADNPRRLDLTLLPATTVHLHMCRYLDVASLLALR